MKIATVSDSLDEPVEELSSALGRCGHDVTVFVRHAKGPAAEAGLTSSGYRVVNVPGGPPATVSEVEALSQMGPFARYLDTHWGLHPPDLVHAYGLTSGLATQLAARRLKLPAVQSFSEFGSATPQHAHLEATVARTADWVAAGSSDEIVSLTRVGRSRRRTSLIPSGVNTATFQPDGPRPAKHAEKRIVMFVKAVLDKEIEPYVSTMRMVPKAEAIIVGVEGGLVHEVSAHLGVGRRVRSGDVASGDLPALLRSADVVVSGDPSGRGVLEAMACGVPVVAPAFGAVRDIVVHDVTGCLVDAANPRHLADAINVLLRDDFRRQSFGAAGRDRACVRYSWDRVAEDLSRLYGELLRAYRHRATISV